MNRLVILLSGSVVIFGLVFFMFQDELVAGNSDNANGNIRTTEVEVNLNCPVDASVIINLIDVYADNSCPRVTIRRLDLRAPNEIIISPTISWLNKLRASLFPLTRDDLQADMELFKSTAITEELKLLLTTPRSIDAKCDYSNVIANYSFKDMYMPYNNLTCYVNRAVAESKIKVVFKVLSCPTNNIVVPETPALPQGIDNQVQTGTGNVNVVIQGNGTGDPSKIEFDYIVGSNTIQWDKSAASNLPSKTFEFEFQYQRKGNWIKSGKIQFAVSDIGEKVISTQEILNAGGLDFINHCHNKPCQLTIFEKGNEYQKIQVSNIDCNDFHK
jgi:hypothetical protein